MPPARRKSTAPSARAQQTLAFSGRANKVTKPSIAPPSAKSISKASSPVSRPSTPHPQEDAQRQEPEEEVEEVEIPNAPAAAAAEEQGLAFRVQGTKPTLHDEVDEKARKVSDAQVKRYWRAKEEERKAPRGKNEIHPLSLVPETPPFP